MGFIFSILCSPSLLSLSLKIPLFVCVSSFHNHDFLCNTLLHLIVFFFFVLYYFKSSIIYSSLSYLMYLSFFLVFIFLDTYEIKYVCILLLLISILFESSYVFFLHHLACT